MIQLVVDNDNDPVAEAWAEFDRRAIELNRAYAGRVSATPRERLAMALATVAAWAKFRDLAVADGMASDSDFDPRPAA